MPEEIDNPKSVSAEPIRPRAFEAEAFRTSDGRTLKEQMRDDAEFERYQIQMSFELFDRFAKLNEKANSVYKSLIILDGAIIGLSITFLASLSSRLSAAAEAPRHALGSAGAFVNQKPYNLHLWMIATSWALLLVAIYCAYRVMTIRHNHESRLYRKIATSYNRYLYSRGANQALLRAALPPVDLPNGAGKVDFSKVHGAIGDLYRSLAAEETKKLAEVSTEIEKEHKESIPGRAAVLMTMTAIILLCAFAICSLPLLF